MFKKKKTRVSCVSVSVSVRVSEERDGQVRRKAPDGKHPTESAGANGALLGVGCWGGGRDDTHTHRERHARRDRNQGRAFGDRKRICVMRATRVDSRVSGFVPGTGTGFLDPF